MILPYGIGIGTYILKRNLIIPNTIYTYAKTAILITKFGFIWIFYYIHLVYAIYSPPTPSLVFLSPVFRHYCKWILFPITEIFNVFFETRHFIKGTIYQTVYFSFQIRWLSFVLAHLALCLMIWKNHFTRRRNTQFL